MHLAKRGASRRKQMAVLLLLRGERLDALRRERGAVRQRCCRDQFLEGGVAGLTRRADEATGAAVAQRLKRAKWLVGDRIMDKEWLPRRIARHEGEFGFSEAEVESAR